MDKSQIIQIITEHLSKKLNCNINDFKTEGVVFVSPQDNPNDNISNPNENRQTPFLEITTMGKGIVVSADADILPRVKQLLHEKSREEIFEFPFIYGQSIYYIPDMKIIKEIPLDSRFTYQLKESSEVQQLFGIKGFDNSIVFDKDGHTSTKLVLYALDNNKVVALAGTSCHYKNMWELGIDVLPQYRSCGLASMLVSNLAINILNRGIIPYYCAASSNIASQAVAYRSGFIPLWVSTYKNILDGSSSFHNIINKLHL